MENTYDFILTFYIYTLMYYKDIELGYITNLKTKYQINTYRELQEAILNYAIKNKLKKKSTYKIKVKIFKKNNEIIHKLFESEKISVNKE